MTYFGQYGIDKVIEDNYLPWFSVVPYAMECGAGNGINDSVCLFFEQQHEFKVVNVEASPDLFNTLTKNRPNSINIWGALSYYVGITKFIHATKSLEIPGGSVSYKKDYDKYLKSLGYDLTNIDVPCSTYDYLSENIVCDYMDLLVLDVEGHEVEVFQGMNVCLPKVICVEYTLSGLEEIKSILIPKGYRFDFVSYNNALFSREIPERDWIGKTGLWPF